MTETQPAETILVAVTGETMAPLLASARWLGERTGARVHVTSVLRHAPMMSWPGAPAPSGDGIDALRVAALRDLLDVSVARLFGSHATSDVSIERGDPARMLTKAARDVGASLIVVGLGRHRPVDRLLGSETTLAIVRLAATPVLALAAEMRQPFQQVVVATDFSSTSERAFRQALPLLASDARVTFVHVSQASRTPSDAERQRSLASRVDEFVARLGIPVGMCVNVELLDGHIAERVLDLADALGADLVIAGRHGHGAIERLLVGNVATYLLRGTTHSMFIAPEIPVVHETPAEIAKESWTTLLDAFSQRNARRRTIVCTMGPGSESQDRGYTLMHLGCASRNRVEVVLSEDGGQSTVRRVLEGVTSASLEQAGAGQEASLHVEHAPNETIISLLPEASRLGGIP